MVDARVEPELVPDFYFDLAQLAAVDPGFQFPGHTFNTGHLVATTGLLSRVDFAPWLTGERPRRVKDQDLFKCGEQGLLNYVLLKAAQEHRVTLGREEFMWWAGWLAPSKVHVADLTADSPWPFLVHWAGPKPVRSGRRPNAHLLRFFAS